MPVILRAVNGRTYTLNLKAMNKYINNLPRDRENWCNGFWITVGVIVIACYELLHFDYTCNYEKSISVIEIELLL